MLSKEQLQKTIDQFDEEELKRQAIFGVFQYGASPEESFIRANQEGLELFALELLKSARDCEAIITDAEKNIIPFDYNEAWIDENSSSVIHYVEPISGKQQPSPKKDYKKTFADRLIPPGCAVVAILLLAAIIVGFVTIWKWLFF